MKNSYYTFPVLLILLAAVGCFQSGCIGYKLGSMLPDGIRSVYIPTFVNNTDEPLLEVETTQAVIAEIQRDGSLRVAEENAADSILTVSLENFTLNPLRFDDIKATQAREYRLTITASIKLVRVANNQIIVENPRVQGESTFEFIGDLTTSKRRETPAAARDLAHDIVEKLVEVW